MGLIVRLLGRNPHTSASERGFSWSRQFPERIRPVSRSRGRNTDADIHLISLLAMWSGLTPALNCAHLPYSSRRVVASQPPRCIRWKRKPGCLSGLCTAFQLILPSSGPPHTPTFKGTCWLQVLMLSGLPQSEAARVLLASPSREMGSSSLQGLTLLRPRHLFSILCCCHLLLSCLRFSLSSWVSYLWPLYLLWPFVILLLGFLVRSETSLMH